MAAAYFNCSDGECFERVLEDLKTILYRDKEHKYESLINDDIRDDIVKKKRNLKEKLG